MKSSNFQSRNVAIVLALAVTGIIAACSEDEPAKQASTAGTGGKGGSGGGSGGSAAGTGGSGGSAAGSGGTGGSAGSGGTTAGTAGSAGSAGTVAAGSGGGGTGGAPTCVPPFTSTGEAGAGGDGGGGGDDPGPLEPMVLNTYTFDGPGSMAGFQATAAASTEPGNTIGDTFMSRSPTEGRSCAGALQLSVPFNVYGTPENSALAQANFTQDWTGRTRVHAAVKIADPGNGSVAHLNGVQFYVQSQNYALYHAVFAAKETFADFGWHDIVLDLTSAPAAIDLTAVNSVGLQLVLLTVAPADPAVPPATIMYVDDIWLE